MHNYAIGVLYVLFNRVDLIDRSLLCPSRLFRFAQIVKFGTWNIFLRYILLFY